MLLVVAVTVFPGRAILAATGSGEPVHLRDASVTAPAAEPQAVSSRPAPVRIARTTLGVGAEAVTVVRPRSEGPWPVVLFLHGWDYEESSAYRSWISHLARRGNAVIVPRYQTSAYSDPATVRPAMTAGFRTALRRLDTPRGPLVVAGHSAGAAMAADYAAEARSLGLPVPQAVFAVFPGRAIIGTPGIPAEDPADIPARVRLTVLAGAEDTVVGEAPARELYDAATGIPEKLRRLIVVRRPGAADHLAPLRRDRPARRAFWRRLDRTISAVRIRAAIRAAWS